MFSHLNPVKGQDHENDGSLKPTSTKGQNQENGAPLKFLGMTYSEILENFPKGVFLVNNRWQIGFFNRAAEEITGYKRDEVLGKFCWEVFHSPLCKKKCPLRATMTNGGPLLDQEVEVLNKDGQKKIILVNTSQICRRGDRKIALGGIEVFRDISALPAPPEKPAATQVLRDIVGASPQMQAIVRQVPMIAASDANVLIQGESGTGKELIARAIHQHSPRSQGPFMAVNCSALTETLLESELFGHERGAFTGAVASKPGRFELAKGGTLFLDEIGDLKPEIQVKLLRVLEEKTFERVGGTRKLHMEARIIAATNRNLKEALRQGAFREDLYYRLCTVPIFLPPLRERRFAIPQLVTHLIEKLNRKFNKKIRGVDPKVMKILCQQRWPGNVRELEHVLEYCFVFAKGPLITLQHLPPPEGGGPHPEDTPQEETLLSPLQMSEKDTIIKALQTANGSKCEAALLLKISRSKLWRKIRLYGIDSGEYKN